MQNETDFPQSFTIESDLGIFIMEPTSAGVYEGSANGFTLNICMTPKRSSFGFNATLFPMSERWDVAVSEISGDFLRTKDLSAFISSWADGICSEVIEAYGEDVNYLETGHGRLAYWAYNTHLDTTPVVFVHGGPGGDNNPVKARRLHLRNPVYLFDQMGCGYSDPISDYGSWTVDTYISEMETFIDSIPSEKVILIGASWGAGLSVAYAGRTECRKIAAMVLPSPYLSSRLWTEDSMDNLKAMGGDYFDTVSEAVRTGVFGKEFTKALGEYNAVYLFNRRIFRDYALTSAEEEPNEVFRNLCGPNDLVTDGKLKDFDVTDVLPGLDVPVLFMCADSDEVPLPRILEFKNKVPGSRLSVVPNAGHVLALEQFECYRDAIVSFLRENGFED